MVLSLATGAQAQQPNATGTPAGSMAAGLDLVGQVPMGDLAKRGLFGYGAMARYEYALLAKLTLTGRAGYVFHPEYNGISKFWVVPILAGAKLTVLGPLFVAGELGLVHAQVKQTTGGIYYGPKNSDQLGATLGAGFRWRQFDARLGFHFLDVLAPGAWTTFAFSVGYTLWFL